MSLFLTCRRKPGQKSGFQVGSLSHRWWVHLQAIGWLYCPESKFTNATALATSVTQFSTSCQGCPPSVTVQISEWRATAVCLSVSSPVSGRWRPLPAAVGASPRGRRAAGSGSCVLLSASLRPQGAVECWSPPGRRPADAIWPSSFRKGSEQRLPLHATNSRTFEKENVSRQPPALALFSCS